MLEELLRATIALIVVMDPVGLIPIIISLTAEMPVEEQKRILNTTLYTASAILIVFALAGQQLLNLFSISLAHFSIAGGLLLLILSLEFLLKGFEVAKGIEVGAVPLAFPLLVGPGSITILMLSLQKYGFLIGLLSALIAIIFTAVVFKFINTIYKLLGRLGSLVITKIMAIFTAAIAIEFIIDGIKAIFEMFYINSAKIY